MYIECGTKLTLYFAIQSKRVLVGKVLGLVSLFPTRMLAKKPFRLSPKSTGTHLAVDLGGAQPSVILTRISETPLETGSSRHMSCPLH